MLTFCNIDNLRDFVYVVCGGVFSKTVLLGTSTFKVICIALHIALVLLSVADVSVVYCLRKSSSLFMCSGEHCGFDSVFS